MFDREQSTVEYIQANWEKYDRLALIYIDRRNGDKVQQKVRTAEEMADPLFQAHLRAANANAQDLYVSMNPLKAEATGRKKSDIGIVRHVYLDVDHGGIEAIRNIVREPGMPLPHHILESSPGRYQAIWSVKDFEPEQAERLMRGMVSTFGADPAATDVSRVLRIPGFRTYKYPEPHYVRDVAETPATQREYTPANFPQFTEQIIRERAQEKQVNAGHGTQSHKDWAWTMRQLENGADPENLIRELVAMRQDKPHPQYYARRTVEEAQKKRSYAQGNSISQY